MSKTQQWNERLIGNMGGQIGERGNKTFSRPTFGVSRLFNNNVTL